jgi:hypothetical protein
MSEQSGEALSTELTERYLRSRGIRYFCGQHDGEYFFVADADGRRLHVHLGTSRWHSDVFTVRVTPSRFFPLADSARLVELADAWNQQNHEVTVVVHCSSDPQRIGVFARSSRRVPDHIPFEEFGCFADDAIAGAIDFFNELAPTADSTSTAQPLLRDAG